MTEHIVRGARIRKETVKKTVDIIEGVDQKGRNVELRILDGETYVYRIDGNLIDSGTKYAEYYDIFDPSDYGIEGEPDEDALVIECVPGHVEEPTSESNYRFVHSDVYKVLVVE